jgi:serine phosphatase RsbU (regulator of sigma subunit)
MSAPNASLLRLRLFFALLGAVCLGLALHAFYVFGSASTDENLFTVPPSPVYLTSPLAAHDGSHVPAGVFLTQIGDVAVKQFGEWEPLAIGGQSAGLLDVQFAPAVKRTERQTARVLGAALANARVVDATDKALVIEVAEGGASHRAGMLVGDLITRIGGKPFANILEADAIMRRGGVGRSFAYDVLRAGEPRSLQVTLARFGIPVPVLLWFASGVGWLLFGTWLLWVRPAVPAARLIGLAFLLLGYGLAVLIVRPDRGKEPVHAALALAPVVAVVFGVACLAHASVFFPREWPTLARARWLPWTIYGLATAGVMLLVLRGSNLAFAAVAAGLSLSVGLIRMRHRADRPADYSRLRRAISVAGGLGVCGAITIIVTPVMYAGGRVPLALVGAVAIMLLALPLAYFYTIGRYRLFDLHLRVRRNVQYSLVSFAWAVVPFAVLLWLLWRLPQVALPLPGVRMTATSLELMDESMPAASRDALEKGVLMVVAILLAFGLREVALRGQRLLATKFHRRGYDYRGAARAITDVTATRLKLEGLGAGLLEVIVTQLPVKRAGLVLIHDRHVHCARGAHGFAEDQWSRLCLQWSGEVLALMRDARGELSADYAPPRIGDALRSAGLEFIYPLRAHDRLVGLLFMGEKQSESAYQNADFEFLAAMASQAAGSVENAFLYEELAGQERLKHELQIARQIQMESLPQFTPRVDGLEVAGISIPAMEVGGDYFDYLNGRRDHLTVMVGDVSGKGTSAALYMSRLQGIVRSLHAFDLSPRELFIRTNQLISRDLERRAFVTALGGFFDTRQGRLVLARAGHLPLYQYRHDRHEVVTWLPRGLGFGLSTRPIFDSELEEATLAYHPGDVFLFLTDGVTECQNGAGELFGEERLLALLTQEAHRAPSATALRDCITSATREFAAGADPYDDQTVVVVRAV